MSGIHNQTFPAPGSTNWIGYMQSGVDATLRTVVVRNVTAATTLVPGDEYVRITSATAVSQPIPIGLPAMLIVQTGAGQITLTPGSGVSLTGAGFKSAGQYLALTLIPTAAGAYDVHGGVA